MEYISKESSRKNAQKMTARIVSKAIDNHKIRYLFLKNDCGMGSIFSCSI
jgi:hypothetical protein